MAKAFFFARQDKNVDAVIEILYYLEIYYREKVEHKDKALKIQRVFHKIETEERDSSKLKLAEDFLKELEDFTPSTAQLNELDQFMLQITKGNPLQKHADIITAKGNPV